MQPAYNLEGRLNPRYTENIATVAYTEAQSLLINLALRAIIHSYIANLHMNAGITYIYSWSNYKLDGHMTRCKANDIRKSFYLWAAEV